MSNLSGATTAVFIVSLSAALEVPVTVAWKTKDGTAKAGTDYEAASGSVTFEPDETIKQIQVAVYGRADGDTETRTFSIELYPPENAILDQTLTEVDILVTDESGTAVTSLVVATGPRGLKGDPGLSAYELAKFQGYEGTLSEWIQTQTAAGISADKAEQEADRASDAANSAETAARAVTSSQSVSVYKKETDLRSATPPGTNKLGVALDTGKYFWWDETVLADQAETTALLARMTTQPTSIQKAAINRLFYDLKQAGLVTKLDGLWLGINTSAADAKLNVLSNSLTLTENNGTVSHNVTAGWTFNGSNWLDTGFNPATAVGKFTKNSASFGVLVAGASNTGVFMGSYDGSNGLSMSRTGNTLTARINSNNTLNGSISPTGTSLFSATRTGETAESLYCGDIVVAEDSSLSLPLISASVSIGRARAASGWYTSATISAAYIGSGLSAENIMALNDAILRYILNFRLSSMPTGTWVKTDYGLTDPDALVALAERISETVVEQKTALLKNAMAVFPQYTDIQALSLDSQDVRIIDESTGVIYESFEVPDVVLDETTALVARMGVKPTAIQQAAINQLMYLLKQDGILPLLDGLWLGISTSYSDSLLNVVQDAFNLTTDKAPTWSQSGGWGFTRSALNYLDTGFNPSLAVGKFALDDASIGVLLFPPVGMAATGHIMGAFNGTNGITIAPKPNDTTALAMQARLNQTTAFTLKEVGAQNAVFAVSRKNGELSAWMEGALLGTAKQVATSLINQNVLLGCSQKTTTYHMFDGALAAAWIGSSLSTEQVTTLTNAIRRYNDIFRGRLSPGASWWKPTGRKVYNDKEIVSLAGTAGDSSSSGLEPPAESASVTASIPLTLTQKGQIYRGGYIEIQPDSFIGGTEPATDGTTQTWGFPHSLTLSEQSRLRNMMFPGGGYGLHYIRLPLGFAYRGFRNIDAATGLAKNIGERYAGQNAALNRLMQNIVQDGGGLAPEYWCPAPYWMTNGKYAGTPSSNNQPWAGGTYPRSTTLDSIKASDPVQYAAQIEALASAMLDDFEYLHQNVGPVRMYGLQNEPQYGHELYGTCKYTDRVYSDLLAVLQPKVASSPILAQWDGLPNTPLLHVASDNDWHIGQTYIDSHADKIWGYSHHNITAIATDADWLKSSTFITRKGDKKNVFVNETEYMNPQNTTNEWKCANNMLRDLHNLVFGGAEVVMPIIHICKQLGESSSYTSNTDGYAIMRCNLPQQYGLAPGETGNESMISYGAFGTNPWNYNAYRLLGDNLPVGAIRVGGEPTLSTNGIGVAAYMAGGKLKLFIVNRNSGVAAITVSLGAIKEFSGKHYDLKHAGDKLSDKSGENITFVLPAYSGQCWTEK